MTRYFESAAARNEEDAVARVLESGAAGGGGLPITETWTGTDGTPWASPPWTITNPLSGYGAVVTNTIQGNRGRLTAGNGAYTLAFATHADSTHTDVDITFVYAVSDLSEKYVETYWRMGATVTIGAPPDDTSGWPGNSYGLDIQPNIDQVNLVIINNAGAGANLATVNSAGVNVTTDIHVRILAVGTNHKVKWWTGTEPSTWQIDYTDPSNLFPSGKFAFGLYNGDNTDTEQVEFDDLSITVPTTLLKGAGAISTDLVFPDDLNILNLSWYYDWVNYSDPVYTHVATPQQYVPEMWGDWVNDVRWGSATGDGSLGGPPNVSIGSSQILLGFNEPDVAEQANMTVARALELWPQLEATGCRLGSPATGGTNSWLVSFMSGNGGGYIPHVDFICAHWYPVYNSGFATLAEYLDWLYTTYNKPIWLTEIGDVTHDVAANAAFMPTVMSTLATRPWVERVAWFVLTRDQNAAGWPGSQLLNANGSLNAAGTQWASYPSGPTPAPPAGGPVALAGSAAGISTATGALSVTRALAGTSGGLSTTTGAMIVARALVGTSGGLSTDTATMLVARTLVGTSGGLSTTTAAMAVGRALVGTSDGVSTDTAAMIVARSLAGTSTGQSTVTGDLAGSSAKTIDGSAGGLSTTTGALTIVRGLAGSAGGSSTADATTLIAQRALVGSAAGLSTTTGALARAVPLAGTAGGLSTTTGALASAGLPGGLADGSSTTTGALIVARALVGTATGTSTTTGAVARAVPMVGSAAGVSTTTGALTVARTLVGSATGVSTAGGTALTVARALVGSADGVAATTASLLATAAGGISGLTAGLSTATGSLSVARPLAGTAGGLSDATGAIAKQIPLASVSAIGVSSAVAVIARGVPLTGTAAGVSTTTAATVVARSLVGSTGGLSTASAPRLVASRTLTGSANGVGDASATTLVVNQGLRGSASGVSSATGTLQTIRIEPVYGLWNGQSFDAMQYGDKQVVDFLMIPS